MWHTRTQPFIDYDRKPGSGRVLQYIYPVRVHVHRATSGSGHSGTGISSNSLTALVTSLLLVTSLRHSHYIMHPGNAGTRHLLMAGHWSLSMAGVIMAGTCMQTLCGKWPKLNKYLMRSRILTLLILFISRLKCNVNIGFLHLEHIFSPHPQSQSLNHHPSGQLLSFLLVFIRSQLTSATLASLEINCERLMKEVQTEYHSPLTFRKIERLAASEKGKSDATEGPSIKTFEEDDHMCTLERRLQY